jgi:hypothetical protein
MDGYYRYTWHKVCTLRTTHHIARQHTHCNIYIPVQGLCTYVYFGILCQKENPKLVVDLHFCSLCEIHGYMIRNHLSWLYHLGKEYFQLLNLYGTHSNCASTLTHLLTAASLIWSAQWIIFCVFQCNSQVTHRITRILWSFA